MDEYPLEDVLHPRAYLDIVRKRFWLILAVVIIGLTYNAMSSRRAKPVYRAKAQVLIERFNPSLVKVDEVLGSERYSWEYFSTQYKLIRSRSLARVVIKKLGLDRHAAFNPKPEKKSFSFNPRKALARAVRTVIPRKQTHGIVDTSEEESDPLTPYIDRYLGMLEVEPVEESRLVNISFPGAESVTRGANGQRPRRDLYRERP
jgi:uncharacterized protein involved in exopolysaccharide biosynthesis